MLCRVSPLSIALLAILALLTLATGTVSAKPNVRPAVRQRRRRFAPFRRRLGDVFETGIGLIHRFRIWRRYNRACGKYAGRFRKQDGSCNNMRKRELGAAGTPFLFLSNRGFRKAPLVAGRKSAREISNIVHHERQHTPSRRGLSETVVFWGQFLDHAFAETENNKNEPFHITVPKNDPWIKNQPTIEFFRSVKVKSKLGFAPVNELTSFIDAAVTYGAHKPTADRIRSFKHGKLLGGSSLLSDDMLPKDKKGFYRSGDARVNENPTLTAFHVLFKREHNRLCDEIRTHFPWWTDEKIYQMARKIVGALQQSGTYYEFLPAVLGRRLPFRGPFMGHGGINPAMSDEFASTAFRVGHTMVNPVMTFIRKNGLVTKRKLSTTFFRPDWFSVYTIEDCFRGMAVTRASEVDVQVNNELRNILFGSSTNRTSMDLVAFNIQRGRDHRMPSYNQLRRIVGLRPVTSFRQITRNRLVQRRLAIAYDNNVNKVDAFTGGLAEDHCCGGSLGPLFRRIWIMEFHRLRSGDRFYFEKWGVFHRRAIRKLPTLNALVKGKLRGRTLYHLLRSNTDIRPKDLKNLWFA